MTIIYSLLVINDVRAGGQHLTPMLMVDIVNTALLYVHVWWQSRRLVFAVDRTRFMNSVTTPPIILAANGTFATNDVTQFVDLQYFLTWDQAASAVLGINVILFSVRLFSLTTIHPVTRVLYRTFYAVIRDIAYFWLIYYSLFCGFALSAMVLLSQNQAGFSSFGESFTSLGRFGNNEISVIALFGQARPWTYKRVAYITLHFLYLALFKWLLTEAVFLGLVLDSWVRVYSLHREPVKHR